MKKNILFLFCLFSKTIFSCECPPTQPVSKELCKKYDVIFLGKIDSVSPCTTDGIATAYFTINELYKGAVQRSVKVDFDCSSDCMMSLSKGDGWLIYSNFQRFNLLSVNICGHSRKLFADANQDIYQLAAQRTFEQERQFLVSALGIQSFMKSNELNKQQTDLGPRNEHPSPMNKLWLLLVSFLVMILVYYVIKKKRGNE